MANIMINQVCNVRCPYCFANEFVNSENYLNNKDSLNMTLENFEKALDFVFTNPGERIGIIGGEPTLHPHFKEILEIVMFDNRVDYAVLFTNGTNLHKYISHLATRKFGMLINCNSPNDIGESNHKKLIENLDILINDFYLQSKITLGINMYKPDFDYEYMLDLLERYGFDRVRTSISVPNTNDKKSFDPLEYFREMKEPVFNFFRELEKRNIVPNYDSNIMPVCIPTPKESEWLKNFSNIYEGCSITGHSFCSPLVDILPDLSAVRCFGLSDQHKVNISGFKTITDLRRYFYDYFDAFAFDTCGSSECETCESRKEKRCTCGCLAFKANKINRLRDNCRKL